MDSKPMTPEEKHEQMQQRNADICAYYEGGHKLIECASKFRLSRQRVIRILQTAGVWRPYVKSGRTQFLGVSIKKETKDALTSEAERQGVSVSKLTSDALDKMVEP